MVFGDTSRQSQRRLHNDMESGDDEISKMNREGRDKVGPKRHGSKKFSLSKTGTSRNCCRVCGGGVGVRALGRIAAGCTVLLPTSNARRLLLLSDVVGSA